MIYRKLFPVFLNIVLAMIDTACPQKTTRGVPLPDHELTKEFSRLSKIVALIELPLDTMTTLQFEVVLLKDKFGIMLVFRTIAAVFRRIDMMSSTTINYANSLVLYNNRPLSPLY